MKLLHAETYTNANSQQHIGLVTLLAISAHRPESCHIACECFINKMATFAVSAIKRMVLRAMRFTGTDR